MQKFAKNETLVKQCLNNTFMARVILYLTCQKIAFTILSKNMQTICLFKYQSFCRNKLNHSIKNAQNKKDSFLNIYNTKLNRFLLLAPVLGRRAPPLLRPNQRIPKCLLNWKCTGIIQTTVTVLVNLGSELALS